MTVEASVAVVTVLFFGKVADQFGRQRQVELPAGGCTVADLRRLLGLSQPGVRASIDRQIVGEAAVVGPGAEVAFFSLFSGG